MKNLLLTTTCLAAVTACTTAKKARTEVKQPNIVVIYLDDLGYGDIIAYDKLELKKITSS